MRAIGACAAATLVCLLAAVPAAGQSTYVAASLVGDIARFSRTEIDTVARIVAEPEPAPDGEALGFGLAVGRRLGPRWGVELEFVRPGLIEREDRSRFGAQPLAPLPLPPAIGIIPIPDLEFERRVEQRHTTLAPTVFYTQDLGDRVALAFSGGVSFSRVESRRSLGVSVRQLLPAILVPDTTLVEYGAGPTAGVGASVSFGDHVAVTGGVRLHGVTVAERGGWLVRPGAGVRWRF